MDSHELVTEWNDSHHSVQSGSRDTFGFSGGGRSLRPPRAAQKSHKVGSRVGLLQVKVGVQRPSVLRVGGGEVQVGGGRGG